MKEIRNLKSTVMLFGASGFIGREIYKELLKDGYKVIPLSSNRNRKYKSSLDSFISVDFHDFNQCRKILNEFRPDVVISTPWVTALPDYRTSELNNLYKKSTIELAKIAQSVGSELFLAFGSSAEYGNSNLRCDSTKSISNPIDFYGRSKYDTYLALTQVFENSQTEFKWLRVFQPYGEHQDSQRLIPYLVSEISAGRAPILRNPDRISDWISTKDIASATLFVMKNRLPQVIDIGTGIGTSNHELELIIREILQKFSSRKDVSVNSKRGEGLVVSTQSPIFLKGWHPQQNLNKALKLLYGSISDSNFG